MLPQGSIVVIDDDADDQYLAESAFQQLGSKHPRLYFTGIRQAFEFIKTSERQPFMIISDLHVGGHTGLELKQQIEADPELRKKSIPFIFLSGSAGDAAITKAYVELSVQGFFLKPDSFEQLKQMLGLLLAYWQQCLRPA